MWHRDLVSQYVLIAWRQQLKTLNYNRVRYSGRETVQQLVNRCPRVSQRQLRSQRTDLHFNCR